MIQIINYSGKLDTEIQEQYKNITFTNLSTPQSLDEFRINILDLRDEKIYNNNGDKTNTINCMNDFRSIGTMIKNSVNTSNIIIMPQNINYKYYWSSHTSRYIRGVKLKDMILSLQSYILTGIHENLNKIKLHYENTITKIIENNISASFYFDTEESILTKSNKSYKPTTIQIEELIMTTLDFIELKDIINFLKEINLIEIKEEVPEWMNKYKMFDDIEQFDAIEKNNAIIKKSNENIDKALEVIKQNERYKSILYTNGDELVEVVFEILEKMLRCNLSDFNDKKKEDFAMEIDGIHYIGEIKGVNHNVKSANISQLDVHYQAYIEENEIEDQENVKALLIINHQRNKPLGSREDVHDQQIKLAKRNGSLIIETEILLKLFERFKSKEVTSEECIEILSQNTGLLRLEN